MSWLTATQSIHSCFLCLLLAACSSPDGGEVAVPAADQAKAAALLESYDSARRDGNWEVAESYADKLRNKFPDSGAAAKLQPSIEQVRSKAGAAREARRLGALWDYQAVAVGKGVQRSAAIQSRTVPVGEGELSAMPDAQLVLRQHPAWGLSAYLLLAQARFDCGQPCVMRIGFDDAPAKAFAGKQADSGKGPALFIEDKGAFIAALSRASRLRIELPKGSGRMAVLTFEVAGYQPSRFQAP